MKANTVRDKSQIGLIDYGLVGIGSILAVYSAGMAISEPSIGIFSASLVALGMLFSYVLRTVLAKTKVLNADGIAYAGTVVLSLVLSQRLNTLMPAEGFPREVAIAGALSWMLILGSFSAWRDGTLLFQAIPAIALFGLVGCYDTFRAVIYAFFGFLLCLATLFARAHTREMLQQAVESGWFNRADAPGKANAIQRSMALYERIRQGPWRWLAGPEWALASAFAVVLVSLVGAPVIRESVREVSGTVRLNAPPIRSQIPPVVGMSNNTEARVGQGPLGPLSEMPLYEAKLDRHRYLRGATYDVYQGNGWRSTEGSRTPGMFMGFGFEDPEGNSAITEIRSRREFSWEIRALAPTNMVPMPGEVVEFRGRPARQRLRDNSGRSSLNFENITVRGRSVEAEADVVPLNAVAQLPTSLLESTSLAGVPESVKDLAREAAKGADNDFERALQIKREIGRRAMYNLKAPAIPTDRDAVEHFLFNQKEGYCDLFASSMVAMARSIGIPARYATGFLPDAERRTGNSFIVVQADAHAWAELFFEDVGWVIFDATEDAEQAPEGGRGQATVGPPWYQSAWFRTAIDVVIVVAVLAAAILLLRSRKPSPGTNLNRKQLERLFVQFVSMLERKTRIRRQLSDTPAEYLAGIMPSLNGTSEAAREINRRFEKYLFSSEAPREEDLAKLKEDLRNFHSMLRKEHTPKR